MRRSLAILCGALAVGAVTFAGAFFLTRQICVREGTNRADELAWLQTEFELSSNAMTHVRQLHEGYLPKCAEMCSRIAAKKQELQSVLAGSANVNPVVEQKLAELGQLRAECQAQMLQHFVEVSQAMPAEQGRRYLAEMQKLTLGSHEQIEQSMSAPAAHERHQH